MAIMPKTADIACAISKSLNCLTNSAIPKPMAVNPAPRAVIAAAIAKS